MTGTANIIGQKIAFRFLPLAPKPGALGQYCGEQHARTSTALSPSFDYVF